MTASGRIEAAFKGRLGDFQLDVAFDIPASGVTVLFGPSGCGKTTVLRCVAGLERLSGRLLVDGETWQDARTFVAPHRRPVGYVFQEASLLAHLSVRRNLLFGFRRTHGVKPVAIDQVTALLGLEPLMERGVERLSGGERQRVAIGRALLSQPRLLLMDEPLASLDQQRKAEVLPYLERLHGELSIPILYVTHDPVEAAKLGDRIISLRDGRASPAVDIAPDDPQTDDLQRRLLSVGPEALTRELIAAGSSEAVAGLAVAALQAGLAPSPG
ncbi:molybdenum ABC transporter ATP-binding protein [Phenylobacterium sp.]|uniref:molybdenum ABC transporter ATP-binding protein n=1 Tax=Phenylobacterium sp. TaxID=1871053 RepID=UPI0027322EDB|nr:molybdenum ABC transporter ATP-binding protein [Phenylobacterium sp.]MDP3658828.1 molybdenum ABC transporter ATP-binding protein [Phenylobacterium sp.]